MREQPRVPLFPRENAGQFYVSFAAEDGNRSHADDKESRGGLWMLEIGECRAWSKRDKTCPAAALPIAV